MNDIINSIEYVKFNKVNPKDFLVLLNNQKIRKHLIKHEMFTNSSVRSWINSKLRVDATQGCKVRAVFCDNDLAGWCGIQLEKDKYELAIVINSEFWGFGKNIFNDCMHWAKELGHGEIFIHFLYTRPEYKFLKKIAVNVYKTNILGNKFTTYQLKVS